MVVLIVYFQFNGSANLMNFIQLSKWLFFSYSIFLYCSVGVFAATIYQWTDPWGQVKYSKTQVQGSMVSELTELPKSQISTEQQKQDAMLNKMQEIKKAKALYQQKKTIKKLIKQQKMIKEKNCQKLRNTLVDIQLKNTRKNYPGKYYYSDQNFYHGMYGYFRDYNYDLLENNLYKEMREYCR